MENLNQYKINQIKSARLLGRGINGALNKESLSLFWAGSALEFCVKATEVWVNVSSKYDTHEPWIAIQVNGRTVNRFMVEKSLGNYWVCIARNLNPQKENLITIMKDTQPMSGEANHSLFINEVAMNKDGEFCKPKDYSCKIEFVGDSITTGEGLVGGPDEQEWITQWMACNDNYAVRTARILDAEFSIMSQCGWGICWGWDGNRNSCIPKHYNKVCSVMWGDYQNSLGVNEDFDFKGGSDFVVINLGTNDNGAFSQQPWIDESGKEYKLSVGNDNNPSEKDATELIEGIKSFLNNVRQKNPNAKIIWVWGMIKLQILPSTILKGIELYKKEFDDKNVFALELDAMEDVEHTVYEKGSRGHPGPKTHCLAAEKISDFIKSLV